MGNKKHYDTPTRAKIRGACELAKNFELKISKHKIFEAFGVERSAGFEILRGRKINEDELTPEMKAAAARCSDPDSRTYHNDPRVSEARGAKRKQADDNEDEETFVLDPSLPGGSSAAPQLGGAQSCRMPAKKARPNTKRPKYSSSRKKKSAPKKSVISGQEQWQPHEDGVAPMQPQLTFSPTQLPGLEQQFLSQLPPPMHQLPHPGMLVGSLHDEDDRNPMFSSSPHPSAYGLP